MIGCVFTESEERKFVDSIDHFYSAAHVAMCITSEESESGAGRPLAIYRVRLG